MAKVRRFEFQDDIATADAAFIAYGTTFPDLLINAGAGLFATMVELERIAANVSREVAVEGDDRDELLYNWLAELVYLKDVYAELYSDFELSITGEGPFQLKAIVRGMAIASLSSHTSSDVKAVTYHRLEVRQTASGFEATVILDL